MLFWSGLGANVHGSPFHPFILSLLHPSITPLFHIVGLDDLSCLPNVNDSVIFHTFIFPSLHISISPFFLPSHPSTSPFLHHSLCSSLHPPYPYPSTCTQSTDFPHPSSPSEAQQGMHLTLFLTTNTSHAVDSLLEKFCL